MLIFVWFASHKDGYRQIADRFDLSISSVFEVITRVSSFLSGLAANVNRFPETEIEKCGFPGIIGCIDISQSINHQDGI
ncbi:hypothetical protein QE152_g27245 [Popillia japonica]|uniref:Transposase Helix-turn-helix domain-containing protein n=1 Tax=Popillia japonica TaxID=7064 RepID=A0AAW1JVJ7_POPJA